MLLDKSAKSHGCREGGCPEGEGFRFDGQWVGWGVVAGGMLEEHRKT